MDYYRTLIKVYEKARGDFSEERAIEIAKFITKQKAIDEREKARRKPKKEEEKGEEREFEPATDKQISYAKDLGIDADFDHISKGRLSELIDRKLKEKGGD